MQRSEPQNLTGDTILILSNCVNVTKEQSKREACGGEGWSLRVKQARRNREAVDI